MSANNMVYPNIYLCILCIFLERIVAFSSSGCEKENLCHVKRAYSTISYPIVSLMRVSNQSIVLMHSCNTNHIFNSNFFLCEEM